MFRPMSGYEELGLFVGEYYFFPTMDACAIKRRRAVKSSCRSNRTIWAFFLATVGYARLLPVDGGCIQKWSISSLTAVVSESKRKRYCLSLNRWANFCEAQLSFVERRDRLIVEIHFVFREPIWSVSIRVRHGQERLSRHNLSNRAILSTSLPSPYPN
jgi:hypothetical protein